MPEVYPDSIKLEMQFAGTAGAWTDVTEDVIRATPIMCTYGIQDSSPLARVASTGTFNFSLDNSELNSVGLVGYYSPGHTNCRTGFQAGITVRFSVIYAEVTYPKFYGRIPTTGIRIQPGSNKSRQTSVEVRDFMEQCAIHEIDSPAFVQNKTAAELVALILAEQSIQPLSTDYNTCEDTFFSAFEDQSKKLNCLSSINDACLSEFGYAYVRHDNYEKFVVEGRKTRTGITSSSVITVANHISNCGYLLKEDGGKIQLEDESGYIKLNCSTTGTASFSNQQYDAVIENGNDVYNDVIMNTTPKTIGGTIESLYLNTSYIPIVAAGTVINGTNYLVGSTTFDFTYKDYSGSYIYGLSYINPVRNTDYYVYDNMQGTGPYTIYTNATTVTSTNLHSHAIGTIYYYFQTPTTSLTLYGNIFQIRGTALKTYTPVSSEFIGTVSSDTFGKSTLDIDMLYQIGTATPGTIAQTLLTQYQDPVTRTENVLFYANSNIQNISSFLVLDIGDRFTYQETVSGISEDYFINGVTFEIYANNVIKFGYKTKQASLEVF